VETDWFTVSIKTSLTPTLIAWILTFYDRITVRKPQELIDQLRRISDDINQRYPI
jgi:predicted DNA-binding transcriptional regulator YafY